MRRVGMLCAGLLAAVYVGYLVVIPFGLVAGGNRLGVPEIVLALALLVAIWFAASNYSITDLSIGASGVSARLARAEARQKVLESDVRALQVALTGLVTKFEWDHLRRLAGEEPVLVRFRQDRKLQQELERLDAMGFVEPKDPRGLNAIPEDHGDRYDEFDLNDYVVITKEGREYAQLRESGSGHP